MTDKKKIHQILSSLWKNDDSVGKVYYNQALQDVQTAVDLQEEPVSEDFEMALAEMIDKAQKCVVEPWVVTAQWKDELIKLAKSDLQNLSNVERTIKEWKEEPISKDLEKAAKAYSMFERSDDTEVGYDLNRYDGFIAGAKWQKQQDQSTTEDLGDYISELSKQFPEVSFAKLSRIAVRVSKWQKEHLWKPADGDDLPEIDREVIALLDNGKVVLAHRPNPEGWDAKSIITEKVERYIPETYGKGGWNIPDVKWWLDCSMPKVEED